jgi:hypothetical protein
VDPSIAALQRWRRCSMRVRVNGLAVARLLVGKAGMRVSARTRILGLRSYCSTGPRGRSLQFTITATSTVGCTYSRGAWRSTTTSASIPETYRDMRTSSRWAREVGELDSRVGRYDLHRVSSGDSPALSLHVYAAPLRQFGIYDEPSRRCETSYGRYDAVLHANAQGAPR